MILATGFIVGNRTYWFNIFMELIWEERINMNTKIIAGVDEYCEGSKPMTVNGNWMQVEDKWLQWWSGIWKPEEAGHERAWRGSRKTLRAAVKVLRREAAQFIYGRERKTMWSSEKWWLWGLNQSWKVLSTWNIMSTWWWQVLTQLITPPSEADALFSPYDGWENQGTFPVSRAGTLTPEPAVFITFSDWAALTMSDIDWGSPFRKRIVDLFSLCESQILKIVKKPEKTLGLPLCLQEARPSISISQLRQCGVKIL